MDRIRYLLVALLAGGIVAVAFQNLHTVDVNLLAWRFSASVALLTLASFLVGLVVGMGAGIFKRSGRRTAEPMEKLPPSEEDAEALAEGAVKEEAEGTG